LALESKSFQEHRHLPSSEKIVEFSAADIGAFTAAVVAASRRFDNTRQWWRGQRHVEWALTPSLYRLGLAAKEMNLNARFRLMAKSRREEVPSGRDPMGWLFLMQHYRLPTRLLDWSQSPLVALYFAVALPDDEDAMLWAMSPTILNVLEARTQSICMPGSAVVGKLGMEAFRRDSKESDSRIIAVLTEEADIRHMVQQSAFTIHGREEPLDQRHEACRFLLRSGYLFRLRGHFVNCLHSMALTERRYSPTSKTLLSSCKDLISRRVQRFQN
jgi:hypothetical protein